MVRQTRILAKGSLESSFERFRLVPTLLASCHNTDRMPLYGLGKGLLEQRCVGACGDSGLVGKLILISIKALRHMSTDLANHP
jgi:hypothetical protein